MFQLNNFSLISFFKHRVNDQNVFMAVGEKFWPAPAASCLPVIRESLEFVQQSAAFLSKVQKVMQFWVVQISSSLLESQI